MARSLKRQLLSFTLFVLVVSASFFGYTYWRIHRFDKLIAKTATEYKLEERLVRAIVYEESYFNPKARSGAGAVGLMQVTPVVITEWKQKRREQNASANFAREMARRVPNLSSSQASKLTEDDLLQYPEINLAIGCWYLDLLRQRYQAETIVVPMMLAGYNAGPSQAERWRTATVQAGKNRLTADTYVAQIDYPETRNYVRRILDRYHNKRGMLGF
jgi:soluble lytic murein transglycosylase